jgi:hypothetical protein
MVARQNAEAVAALKKGVEDVEIGVGVATPRIAPQAPPQGVQWNQGDDSMVEYSTNADELASKLAKGGEFYEGGEAPTLTRTSLLINDRTTCPACKTTMAKALAVCPECGAGAMTPRVTMVVEAPEAVAPRRGPRLQPRRVEDVKI